MPFYSFFVSLDLAINNIIIDNLEKIAEMCNRAICSFMTGKVYGMINWAGGLIVASLYLIANKRLQS